jgi:hypothetical protein
MNMLVDMEALDGEIFGPEETVRFFLFEHALNSKREIYTVPAGMTITESLRYVREMSGKPLPTGRFAFYLQDGTRVPEELWDNVKLKNSTNVVARPIAEAPIFAVFAAISSVMAATSAFFASMGIFGQLLLTGLTMGAKFLLAKLFAPKPPPQPTKSDAVPVYSISGSRNQIAQWQPIPLLLGRHRMTPPLAASPYSETVGDEQYLRQLFCNGYGPLYLEEATAKIGETLVSSFPEAEIQHRYGYYVGEPKTTLYPSSVIDLSMSVELKQAEPEVVQATATDSYQVALDFYWPQGLCNIDNKGKRRSRKCTISLFYRTYPGGGYVRVPDFNLEASTQKAIRRTVIINLPFVGQFEVRVHKESGEPGPDFDKSHWIGVDTVMWTAIRSFRTGEPVRFTDAPVSFTALRVRASGRINSTVDTYNIIAQSRVLAFNGSTWVANQPSRWPPDLFRWVLQCGANRRPYPDSKIDIPALQQWWFYCTSKGWVYDKLVIAQTSVYDLLVEICAAGRAMPVFKDGKWSVVWDDLNVPVTQLFTPRNSWNFEEQRDLDPIPHGFRVRFPNEEKGWIEDERVIYNDGYNKANATLLEGFDTPGQTHTDRVWKHGRFHLAQRILRPGTFTIYTSWDALPLIRGDRVRVNFDSFKYGLYSGRVVAIDVPSQTVKIDTNILLNGASNYMFRFRLNDGSFLTRTIDPGYVGEFTLVGLVGDSTMSMPQVGNMFSMGYADQDSRVFRVVGIEPMEDLVHRLSLVADAPEIAYADIGQIPNYTEGITEPIDPYTMPPRNVTVKDGVYTDGGVQYWANLIVDWEPPPYGKTTFFEVQYREDKDAPDTWVQAAKVGATITETDIRRLESGIYTVRVRCIFDNGKFSNWATAPAKATTEYTTPPPDVTNFRISTMGDISILRWDEILGVGISYELRYAAMEVVEPTWNSSIPLVIAVANNVQIGTRTGTFFIKARKPWGLTSTNATLLYTAVGSLTGINYITQIQEEPLWLGTHVSTEVDDEELRLIRNHTNETFDIEGTYTFANMIDLGENINSRLSIMLDAYGFNPQTVMATWVTLDSVDPLDSIEKGDWEVIPQYRTTDVDPTLNQWTNWTPLGLTDVLAWAMQFRLILRGKIEIDIATDILRSLTSPSVQRVWITIDMVDRIEKGEDITAPAAGITVTYPGGKFRVVPAVVVTPQDMAQGDYYRVTAKTDTSFKVQFWNASNTAKSLTFDWMAKGWGRIQTP